MAQSITIASGKGGVGKTCIAVNVALALGGLGHRVKLLDADFGLANSHILMGVNARRSLRDVVNGQHSIEEVIENVAPRVDLLAGGSGLSDMLNLDPAVRYQLIRNMDALAPTTDVLIIDAPAGASDNALAFVAAADRVLVVIVGEPTSFMDAYALIKAAHLEQRVSRFSIVVNMARDSAEAERHFTKFRGIALRFLDVELTYAGHVPLSSALRRSVVARRPLMSERGAGETVEGVAFRRIAGAVLRAPMNPGDGIRFFQTDSVGQEVRP
jgi:flagellar biosynthesis protein FlhG